MAASSMKSMPTNPALSNTIAAVVVGAGYLTASHSAAVLAALAIWRYDGDESDELPCGGCAEHTYAIVRDHINDLLRQRGFDDQATRALEEHASTYLADCFTHAMLECAWSAVTVPQMYEEILAAVELRANQFGDELDALLDHHACRRKSNRSG